MTSSKSTKRASTLRYKPIAEFVQAFNHKPPFLGCKRKVIFLFHRSGLL